MENGAYGMNGPIVLPRVKVGIKRETVLVTTHLQQITAHYVKTRISQDHRTK